LAKDLKSKFPDATVDFIEGTGGVFDVTKNGILIFSKTQVGRFPNSDEIVSRLKE
jgi:selT/selW/selH-like putative selenoprotein